MVDQALAATGTTQARLRVLPSRVVVYLLLAGCLFAGLGDRQVWHKLTAGLGKLPVANPGGNALWQARARLGAAPLRWLFDLLRGPATAVTAGPVRWCGLLVCAIDGTTLSIPIAPGTWPHIASSPAATAGRGTRCCGWWPWWPAAPGPSSTRSSAPPAAVSWTAPAGCAAACT